MQKIKVACIGNMNNMLFSLCRYLRDRGIDSHLFLAANELNGLEHFLPENDTYTNEYLSYTHNLDWGAGGSDVFKNNSLKKIQNDLREFTYFIVSGTSIAYLSKASICADVFFPHGSDIKYVPFLDEKMSFLNKLRNPYGLRFFKHMKNGIKNAKNINIEHSDPFWYEPLEKLNVVEKATFWGCPMVYAPIYSRSRIINFIGNIPEVSLYRKLRAENDLIVVNQASQTWVKPFDNNGRPSKGSNKLILGFYKFLQQKNQNYNAKLILFEYGNDVLASKELINSLQISDHVIWHPKAPRKVIMALLHFADFGCGEFEPGCIGGNTTWEALVSGTCLLHYLNEEHTKFNHFLNTPYPFINVKEAHEISSIFLDFMNNNNKYREIGAAGEIWYNNFFSEKSVNEWVNKINLSQKPNY